jgi:hypothetical protein
MNNSPTVLPRAAKPSFWQGCAKTMADPYKGEISLTSVNKFQEPFASCHVIKQKGSNTWSLRTNQYLEPGTETHTKQSYLPIATD